ncbi:MAG: maleylpyruvate isomerase N-terminal domain-containing protein [Actinomycetota bacterium]
MTATDEPASKRTTATTRTSGTVDEERIWAAVAIERRRLADELEQLTDAQWRAQSQCEAWTIEQAAVHLITPFEVSTPRFLFTMLRHRGNVDKIVLDLTARVGAKVSRSAIPAKLREHAENRWTPPRLGPAIPFSEVGVPAQDIRRPLGMV